MDDIRGSLSKLKKGIKLRFSGNKRKGDKMRAVERGERDDSSGSLPQPEPHVVVGSGREQEGNETDADYESAGPSAAADENRPGWKSTASASAKLLLRGVRDSADAFGPLKSVAGGLCFILENYEVRHPPSYAIRNAYRCPANEGKQTSDRGFGTPGRRACRAAL